MIIKGTWAEHHVLALSGSQRKAWSSGGALSALLQVGNARHNLIYTFPLSKALSSSALQDRHEIHSTDSHGYELAQQHLT